MSAEPGFPLSDMVYGKANVRVSRTIKGPNEVRAARRLERA